MDTEEKLLDSEELDVPTPSVISAPLPSSLEPYQPEQPNPWPEVVDSNLTRAIDTYKEIQKEKTETERDLIGIDKSIMLVFAIALLGSLFFTFYMIAVDKLDPVNKVLYPIVTAILGFMSGYFAGSGRARRKG